MNEEPVAGGLGLLSLPEEVLLVIGEYLSARDLLAVSEVCRYLRSVFNVNSLWRKYTDGGRISQGLDNSLCVVQPELKISNSPTLESLCEHRLHFLKQSRLLSNLRQGRFVEHTTQFHGFLSDFETVKPLNNRQITYGGKYLFTVDYDGDVEVIKIFDIESAIKLLLTVNLENHSISYCVVTWVQVVKDKLIVRRDDWFDIYKINVPESLDIVHSINVDNLRSQRINQTLIIGSLLFVENFSLNVVHIWDLRNGNQSKDLSPKVIGPDFNIIGYSQNEKYVILSVGLYLNEGSQPHVFVYDIESQDFSPFSPVLNASSFKCLECYGLIDSDYVVILNERSSLNYSVFVFSFATSTLLVEKSDLVTRRIEDAKIIGGCLVLPSLVSVLVMHLTSLQNVWEIQLDSARSLLYEFPLISMVGMEVLHIFTLCSIIVIHKVSGIEMWDLNKRKKLFDLSEKGNVVLNDNCTKLIFCDFQTLKVLSFW